MALSATLVWELRPGAGNDANGGGYKPGATGTDFSQQNSPQYALTGIATAGAGAVFLSASAAADMVGNIVQVVSGTNFTAGFYEITSVSVGVSVTVDRNLCTGVGASGVLNIGGALATYAITEASVVTDNTIHVKNTNVATITTGLTLDVARLRIKWIGYASTRGDNGMATLTTATDSINLVTYPTSTTGGYSWTNFKFTNTASVRAFGHTAGGGSCYWVQFINCLFDGFSIGVNGRFSTQHTLPRLLMVFCEVKNCTTQGLDISGPATLVNCLIWNNTGNGLLNGEGNGPEIGPTILINCVFALNSSRGVDNPTHGVQRHVFAIGCAFVDNTSDGLRENNGGITLNLTCINCVFWSNGGYGVNLVAGGSADPMYARANAYGDNTTAARLNFVAATDDVALTVNPFTNSAAGDFSLNATAGGGAALKNVGFDSLPLN